MASIPSLNTIALGGVATGKQNAKEHATVVGTMRSRGFTPSAPDRLDMIGCTMDAVEVFEVNSVRKPAILS